MRTFSRTRLLGAMVVVIALVLSGAAVAQYVPTAGVDEAEAVVAAGAEEVSAAARGTGTSDAPAGGAVMLPLVLLGLLAVAIGGGALLASRRMGGTTTT